MYLEQIITDMSEMIKFQNQQIKELHQHVSRICSLVEASPERLSRADAAKAIGICVATLDTYVKNGYIEPIRQGTKVFFLKTDVVRIQMNGVPKRKKDKSKELQQARINQSKRFAVPYVGKSQRAKRSTVST